MIIVSSCLAGCNCRYDGKSNSKKEIIDLVERGEAIPLCAELIGGLPIPRKSCEIINNRVVDAVANDYTDNFEIGAKKILEIAKILNIKKAILQQKSPSCGYGKIYDGTFSGKLIEGNGILAELLAQNGIDIESVE